MPRCGATRRQSSGYWTEGGSTMQGVVDHGDRRYGAGSAGRVGARDFHTSSGAPLLPERPADTLAGSDGA